MEKILIMGGAGFVGSNLAHHFLQNYEDLELIVFDDFSRKGVEHNIAWLRDMYGEKIKVIQGDVRNIRKLSECMKEVSAVCHTAAQVAVTTSITNPILDFEVNVQGTLNVLEAARRSNTDPTVVFTSTNKVYGDLSDVETMKLKTRYNFKRIKEGIDENFPLKPCTPYGISKCSADLYCLDYYKTYGLKTVVFRMSCIYGPRQFGTEDQGWVAHFVISALLDKELTIYGDGKQIRDLLYIDDLARAFDLGIKKANVIKGEAYNIGGGPENTFSPLELIDYIQNTLRKEIKVKFSDWRVGDQKVYYSNLTKAKHYFGWAPQVSKFEGVKRLLQWCMDELSTIRGVVKGEINHL